jgi:pSer/pThr/pTyr-binding forkhead associated (FHA) protein
MIIRLQHVRSDGESDLYHLKSGRRYHIGRGSGCEVRILDLKLSRKHCAIEFDHDGWQLVDLASTNGCKLDGEQLVGSAPLKAGSVIMIGQTELSVTRILADDEVEDEQTAMPEPEPVPEPVTKEPTEKVPVLKPVAAASSDELSGEHKASDWEPMEMEAPEPAAKDKKGSTREALVPLSEAEDDLASYRRAAQASVERAKSVTGQLQRPSFPTPEPGSLGSVTDKPLISNKVTTTPLPEAAVVEDSGPFSSLSPRAPSSDDDLFADEPAKPAAKAKAPEKPVEKAPERVSEKIPGAPPKPVEAEKRPGTASERRVKPKVVPIVLQPSDAEDESTVLPTTPARGTPILGSERPAPAPAAAAPVPSRPTLVPAAPPPRSSPPPAPPPSSPPPAKAPVQGRVIQSGSEEPDLEQTSPTLAPRAPARPAADDVLDLDDEPKKPAAKTIPPVKPAPSPLSAPTPLRTPSARPPEPVKPAAKAPEPLRPETPRLPSRPQLDPPRAAFEQDHVATLPSFQFDENKPPAPKPTLPPAPGQLPEKPFFITVLGRRVGPLTREKARDLKARELKGTLTAADLEQFS